ncbi:hypothetical protein M408DRAFT_327919 [Serendipita vermifera MAFF 305830]|uniref:Uncharacterized protein n=1 Tax=Serendipita vermifera MAFF 305830 TaxID=933852 RepID=A0A0C2XPX6_SERVB|nr:hypothetical protein M408DRAFT_327919 [Serendipita vermifera MAFF 305830]
MDLHPFCNTSTNFSANVAGWVWLFEIVENAGKRRKWLGKKVELKRKCRNGNKKHKRAWFFCHKTMAKRWKRE